MAIKKEKQKEELKDSRTWALDYTKKKKLSDIKGMIKEIKFANNTEASFVINMYLRNGTRSTFIVFPDKDASFNWKKRRFIIDEDFKYYDNTTRNWALNFHEDLSIPFSIDVNVQGKKKNIVSNNYDVTTAINPSNLEIYMKSSFVEKIMKGEEMDKIFKKIIVVGTVSAIASVFGLFLLLKMSGMLDALNF